MNEPIVYDMSKNTIDVLSALFSERVNRGADALDKAYPNWLQYVWPVGTPTDDDKGILATLYDDEEAERHSEMTLAEYGAMRCGGKRRNQYGEVVQWMIEHGFLLDGDELDELTGEHVDITAAYEMLDDMWGYTIAVRQGGFPYESELGSFRGRKVKNVKDSQGRI